MNKTSSLMCPSRRASESRQYLSAPLIPTGILNLESRILGAANRYDGSMHGRGCNPTMQTARAQRSGSKPMPLYLATTIIQLSG